MIAGTAAIWVSPMAVGQYFGSLTIACFSFGSFLALSSMVDLFTAAIAGYARSMGYRVRPGQSSACSLRSLYCRHGRFADAVVHKVRLCDGKCASNHRIERRASPKSGRAA